MEFPKAIIALMVVVAGNAYIMGIAEDSARKEIATACSSGNQQFNVGNTTFHCGIIRSEVLSQTKKRRQEQLAESCTKYMMGLEQW